MLSQGIAEEVSKKQLLQEQHDSLCNDIAALEMDVLHKEQHLRHLCDNALVYKKLLREEETRMREMEDIITAQDLYMEQLADNGLHLELGPEAQQESLRKAMIEATRTRTNRAAVAGIDQSAATRYVVLNAQLEAQASSASFDAPLSGFDPTTGEMTLT